MIMKILETNNLKKYYGKGENIVKALDGINISINRGEFIAIVGTIRKWKEYLVTYDRGT